MSIAIKQSPTYFSYDLPGWVELYNRTVVTCECGSLMERDMGLCDRCIERESVKMQADLEEILKDVDSNANIERYTICAESFRRDVS